MFAKLSSVLQRNTNKLGEALLCWTGGGNGKQPNGDSYGCSQPTTVAYRLEPAQDRRRGKETLWVWHREAVDGEVFPVIG